MKKEPDTLEKEPALLFCRRCLYFYQIVFSGTKAQSGSGFDGMNTIVAFNTFDEVVTTGIISGINQVQTSLVNGNGV